MCYWINGDFCRLSIKLADIFVRLNYFTFFMFVPFIGDYLWRFFTFVYVRSPVIVLSLLFQLGLEVVKMVLMLHLLFFFSTVCRGIWHSVLTHNNIPSLNNVDFKSTMLKFHHSCDKLTTSRLSVYVYL